MVTRYDILSNRKDKKEKSVQTGTSRKYNKMKTKEEILSNKNGESDYPNYRAKDEYTKYVLEDFLEWKGLHFLTYEVQSVDGKYLEHKDFGERRSLYTSKKLINKYLLERKFINRYE